jgi:hypothetical protein
MMVVQVFASFILSFLVSIPITLATEAPFLQLERLVLFPPKKKSEVPEARVTLLKKDTITKRTPIDDTMDTN